LVHPREVFRSAIVCAAASIILIHNHPSGDPAPSTEDMEIAERLIEASKIMGIEILDFIIIGRDAYFSFKREGFL
ncbi:MAG: JAB domain-containing protein, partial [Candidatus Hydrothermarchaeales archaeon]